MPALMDTNITQMKFVNTGTNPGWKMYNLIWLGITCGVLIFVGIICSILTLLLLRIEKLIQKGVKTILLSITIVDFLFLIFALFYTGINQIIFTSGSKSLINFSRIYVADAAVIGVNICEMFRNLLTTLMAVERFIATNYPLKARYCIREKGIILIILLLLFSVTVRIPLILRRVINPRIKESTQFLTIAHYLHTNIDLFVLSWIPLLIIVFCSIKTYLKITESLSARKQSVHLKEYSSNTFVPATIVPSKSFASSSSPNFVSRSASSCVPNSADRVAAVNALVDRRQFQIAKMLLMIVILFVVFSTPQMVLSILDNLNFYFLQGKSGLIEFWIKILKPIVWTFSIGYSASNFFVYVAYMKKYRTIVANMLFHCSLSNLSNRRGSESINCSNHVTARISVPVQS